MARVADAAASRAFHVLRELRVLVRPWFTQVAVGPDELPHQLLVVAGSAAPYGVRRIRPNTVPRYIWRWASAASSRGNTSLYGGVQLAACCDEELLVADRVLRVTGTLSRVKVANELRSCRGIVADDFAILTRGGGSAR